MCFYQYKAVLRHIDLHAYVCVSLFDDKLHTLIKNWIITSGEFSVYKWYSVPWTLAAYVLRRTYEVNLEFYNFIWFL